VIARHRGLFGSAGWCRLLRGQANQRHHRVASNTRRRRVIATRHRAAGVGARRPWSLDAPVDDRRTARGAAWSLHHLARRSPGHQKRGFVTANARRRVVAFREMVAAVWCARAGRDWPSPEGQGQHPARLGQRSVPLQPHFRRAYRRHAGTLAAEKKRPPWWPRIAPDLILAASPSAAAPVGAASTSTHPVHSSDDGTLMKLGVMWGWGGAVIVAGRDIVAMAGSLTTVGPSRPRRAGRTRFSGASARHVGWPTSGVRLGNNVPASAHASARTSFRPTAYKLTIATSGFGRCRLTPNYYRFFGTTEAPFDWYQSVLATPGGRSARPAWGCGCPRRRRASPPGLIHQPLCACRGIGRRLANNRVAVWTAGAPCSGGVLPVQQRPSARARDTRLRHARGVVLSKAPSPLAGCGPAADCRDSGRLQRDARRRRDYRAGHASGRPRAVARIIVQQKRAEFAGSSPSSTVGRLN